METTKKKWTRRMYTPEFKLEVLSYYYTHGEHRRKTYEKFGISETNLRQWLKNYRIEKKRIIAVGTGECIPNETPARYRQPGGHEAADRSPREGAGIRAHALPRVREADRDSREGGRGQHITGEIIFISSQQSFSRLSIRLIENNLDCIFFRISASLMGNIRFVAFVGYQCVEGLLQSLYVS